MYYTLNKNTYSQDSTWMCYIQYLSKFLEFQTYLNLKKKNQIELHRLMSFLQYHVSTITLPHETSHAFLIIQNLWHYNFQPWQASAVLDRDGKQCMVLVCLWHRLCWFGSTDNYNSLTNFCFHMQYVSVGGVI